MQPDTPSFADTINADGAYGLAQATYFQNMDATAEEASAVWFSMLAKGKCRENAEMWSGDGDVMKRTTVRIHLNEELQDLRKVAAMQNDYDLSSSGAFLGRVMPIFRTWIMDPAHDRTPDYATVKTAAWDEFYFVDGVNGDVLGIGLPGEISDNERANIGVIYDLYAKTVRRLEVTWAEHDALEFVLSAADGTRPIYDLGLAVNHGLNLNPFMIDVFGYEVLRLRGVLP